MAKSSNGDLNNLYFTRALLSKIAKNESQLVSLKENKKKISERSFTPPTSSRKRDLKSKIASIDSRITSMNGEIHKLANEKKSV